MHDANVQSFLMGEALKKARLSKNLTQEELGKIIGVKRALISRIEKGYNLTLGTVSKVLKAIGVAASLHVNGIGKVVLS